MSPARRGVGFDCIVALPVALLVAAASAGGIWLPSTYARETPSWAAQGIGQDWVDLLVVAPLLAAAGVLAIRGSVRARALLGGAYAYTAYSFVLYAFEVHFNALFLVYCAALGLSVQGLLVHLLHRVEDARQAGGGLSPSEARVTGAFLATVGIAFALLWLADVLPALAQRRDPAGLAETGLFTNPVHVLDLALALPFLVGVGVALLRRHPVGRALAPTALGFDVLMPLAIGGMMLSMRARGLSGSLGVAGAMGAEAVVSAVLLVRAIRPGSGGDVVALPTRR